VQGTEKFKAGLDFAAAAALYVKAADWLEEASALRESCFNNAALCYLKAKQFVDAIKFASKAIEDEPKNSKAFYRRATAYMEIAEFKKAKSDLDSAQQIDPEGKAIKKAFKKLAKRVAADKELRKKKFGGIFSKMKGGMYNNKPNVLKDPTTDPANKRVRL